MLMWHVAYRTKQIFFSTIVVCNKKNSYSWKWAELDITLLKQPKKFSSGGTTNFAQHFWKVNQTRGKYWYYWKEQTLKQAKLSRLLCVCVCVCVCGA